MVSATRIKGLLALIFSLILWSSAFVAIKTSSTSYSAGGIALFRFLIASFILFIYYFFSKNSRGKLKSRDIFLCFLIGASLAGYQIGLNIGEKYVPASLASFIVGTQPVIVMIMAFFFLKEKITLYTLIGLSISVAGIFIIFYSNSEDAVNFNVSTLIILAATLSNALYLILQKPLLKKYTAIQILPWYVWFTTFVLLPYFPGLIHDVNNAAFHDSMGVVYLGIFPTLIAFALWTYAISIIPLSKAASGFYLIPLFTMIIGYLFLHETLGVCTLLGGLVTVAGALIINRR